MKSIRSTVFTLILTLNLFIPATPLSALSDDTATTAPLPLPPLLLTEIYPNAPGAQETGKEFVKITNTGDNTVSLKGYGLSVKLKEERVLLPDDLSLQPQASLIIFPVFSSLLNGGETVTLTPPEDIFSNQVVTYQAGITDSESLQLIDDGWVTQTLISDPTVTLELNLDAATVDDTENEDSEPPADEEVDNAQPEIPDEEVNEREEPNCEANFVRINEIVANPSGDDSAGGEFIELYNDGNQSVDLTGCLLSTDKKNSISLGGMILEPGAYYAVELSDDLLNSGGTVMFITANDEYAIEYPALKDDESYSLINDEWQKTSVMTPSSVNEPTPKSKTVKTTENTTLTPCPEGKFRNPETNRCKNIADTAGSLLPCAAGSVRNPETNRCRKLTTLTAATLTPCKEGQERNPETNRCRQVASGANDLKPCEEGQERNPETNRCRKATGTVAASSTFNDTPQERGLHPSILIAFTVFAVGYALYEYRLDFLNRYQGIKSWQKKRKQLKQATLQ